MKILVIDTGLDLNPPVINNPLKDGSQNVIKFVSDLNN
jgi:hypothetical protein